MRKHMLIYSGVRLIRSRAVELLQGAILGAGISDYGAVNRTILYSIVQVKSRLQKHVDCICVRVLV